MLNIFADALLIATRMGGLPERQLPRRPLRRSPREFLEVEGLHTADYLRSQAR